jgi:hypothetical protein
VLTRFIPPITNNTLLINLLKLSRFFISPTTRQYALHTIEGRKWHFTPCELIYVCVEFNTKQLFVGTFQRLVETNLYELSIEDVSRITHTVFVALARLREILEEHRRIIATEPPSIISHAEDCVDNLRCSQDWYSIWWNGMGRCLLDGRNPLSFDEAFKRFELLHFGGMGEGCKKAMLGLIKDGCGFGYGDRYTLEVATYLANSLIVEEENVI